jgi:hypothetical protein
MARPQKPAAQRRTIELRIRVTTEERESVVLAADRAGKTIADYVRFRLGLSEEGYGTTPQERKK